MCEKVSDRLRVYTRTYAWLRAHVHKFVFARESEYACACTYARLCARDCSAREHIHVCAYMHASMRECECDCVCEGGSVLCAHELQLNKALLTFKTLKVSHNVSE